MNLSLKNENYIYVFIFDIKLRMQTIFQNILQLFQSDGLLLVTWRTTGTLNLYFLARNRTQRIEKKVFLK
jgi:hypothetical protein